MALFWSGPDDEHPLTRKDTLRPSLLMTLGYTTLFVLIAVHQGCPR